MNKEKKTSAAKMVVLVTILSILVIVISAINMRTVIKNSFFYNIGKQATSNSATKPDVLENYTFTSGAEEGIGIEGTMSDYSKTVKKIKLTAAAANKEAYTVDLGDENGYYESVNLDVTDIYNAGVSDSMVGSATAANVLKGKTFTNSTTVGETGTMMDIVNTEGKVGYNETSGAKYVIATQAAVGAANVYDTNDANTHKKLGYYIGVKYTGGAGYLANNTWFLTPATNFGEAAVGNVLTGKTFTSTAGVKKTGTMANVAAIDPAKSLSVGSTYTYVRMTNGAHITNASSGYPEVRITNSDLATAAGITDDKIVSGNTVLGIAGTGGTGKVVFNTAGWIANGTTSNVFLDTDLINSTYFTKNSNSKITVKKNCTVTIKVLCYAIAVHKHHSSATNNGHTLKWSMAINGTNFVNQTKAETDTWSEWYIGGTNTVRKNLKAGDVITGSLSKTATGTSRGAAFFEAWFTLE